MHSTGLPEKTLTLQASLDQCSGGCGDIEVLAQTSDSDLANY